MDIHQLGPAAASIAIGYLLGSAPVAYLAARSRGVDILKVGTRNPGAANLFRTVSRPLGIVAFLGDVLKGCAAVAVANTLGVPAEVVLTAGAAALVGHWYPIFLGFRGGAGLATAIGAGIGLAPWPGLGALALGLLVLAFIRNTGIAAGIGYTGFVLLSFLGTRWETTLGATLLGVIVLLRTILVQNLLRRRGAE